VGLLYRGHAREPKPLKDGARVYPPRESYHFLKNPELKRIIDAANGFALQGLPGECSPARRTKSGMSDSCLKKLAEKTTGFCAGGTFDGEPDVWGKPRCKGLYGNTFQQVLVAVQEARTKLSQMNNDANCSGSGASPFVPPADKPTTPKQSEKGGAKREG
jgi:hypothetical protein